MTGIERPSRPAVDEVQRVELRQDVGAAAEARGLARRTLAQWLLPARVVDDVVLAVSELVTNAIRYGRPPVELTLSRGHRGVRVDVYDEGGGRVGTPRPVAGMSSQTGRGLAIVTAVADTVGCDVTEGRPGKSMYATFLLCLVALATLVVRPR